MWRVRELPGGRRVSIGATGRPGSGGFSGFGSGVKKGLGRGEIPFWSLRRPMKSSAAEALNQEKVS